MHYTIKEKKALPKAQFQIVLELSAEEVGKHRAHVLSHLKKNTELPGFRKGFVPEKILRERMGEMALWEEAAADALGVALAEIFRAEKLDVIGRPQVETVKLAPENQTEFKVTLSLYPELALPDYKKVAEEHNIKKPEKTTVEEKEIDTVLAEIKKQHETESGKKDFAITDETVKEFGKFETVADFRAKVKEGLTSHKEERGREKRRAELLDKLTDKAKGELPDVLIESELSRMESELRSQIEQMGARPNGDSSGRASFENYLKEIKKDKDALRKEWSKDAERRARLQLVLFQIAQAEKLTASEAEVATEVKHLIEHYKNANPENARSYVETLLTNQKVLAFLENQK